MHGVARTSLFPLTKPLPATYWVVSGQRYLRALCITMWSAHLSEHRPGEARWCCECSAELPGRAGAGVPAAGLLCGLPVWLWGAAATPDQRVRNRRSAARRSTPTPGGSGFICRGGGLLTDRAASEAYRADPLMTDLKGLGARHMPRRLLPGRDHRAASLTSGL